MWSEDVRTTTVYRMCSLRGMSGLIRRMPIGGQYVRRCPKIPIAYVSQGVLDDRKRWNLVQILCGSDDSTV